MGEVITFYSYKGGVGRTMTIANTAAMLAARGWRVLAVDWDLEAPGLHHYFHKAMARVTKPYGLMDLMASAASGGEQLNWRSCRIQCLANGLRLDLLPSGVGQQGYEHAVTKFDWVDFFVRLKGEQFLENLRNEWMSEYDFVVIDSRTGISDTSGICTVFMPDILVLVLTANEQSLGGTEYIVKHAPVRRNQLRKSRSPLTFVPIISRWDGREETKEADKWLKSIQDRLTDCVTDWFPVGRDVSELFMSLRIPHVAYFSFGEKLPVLTDATNDTEKPGFYYSKLADLLETLSDPNGDLDRLWRPNENKRGWRKVVLCGPRQELNKYWSVVKTLMQNHGIDLVAQEEFHTSPRTTPEVLREVIGNADAAIMLIGKHLGAYAPPPHDKPYLEIEYELARELGKPIFPFVFNDKSSTSGEDSERSDATKRFVDRIRAEHLISEFSDGFELRSRLATLLSQPATRIAPSRIAKNAAKTFFGREIELSALDAAWANDALNVYTLVSWGGVGKTSLVFHWVQTRFAARSWSGVERYFDWSFSSQGFGDSRQTSADLFIAKALEFFGDPDPTGGGAHERGERLAGLIRQHRTLLILDGIEPLQYPPNDPQTGRLKDPALESLLRELAADNPGLVVITTRQGLATVEGHASTEEQKLDKLAPEAGVALLRHLQIVGSDEELHAAWQEAGGHALTLSLLGRFIADAYEDRDIRHYREVKFEAAEQEHQGRSAFEVMRTYEQWLGSGGPQRQRELAVLRLTGLFDRPLAKTCLQALRAEPSIPGLTDSLVKLTQPQWNIAVKRLSEVELLSVSSDAIDAHPLIREYFAAQLKREQPEAFMAAHSRLFDYLCENTPYRPDGMDGLAPLYKAVTHGCLAGRHQEACDKVYRDRILRGTGSDGFYSTRKLGAIGADLAAVAAFFDEPWSKLSPNLTETDQAWLLNAVAFSLRALGRLTEALQPMRAGLERYIRQMGWKEAAISASNLSEMEVTLGRLPDAVTDARQSITHADQSGDTYLRIALRNTLANALHHSGQRAEAGALFADAERMQKERQPEFDLLYSMQGYQYCDWLLAPAEQAAWQIVLRGTSVPPLGATHRQDGHATIFDEVERRATTTLAWVAPQNWLLDIALDHLTLARVGLIRAILASPLPQPTLDLPHVAAAVNGLRAAGQMDHLPRGLLTASLYHFVRGEHDLARKHLVEAQQIAERGPMPLYLADIHLHRARMFHDKTELAHAAQLIRKLGYGRRTEELAAAEEAANQWPT